MIDTPTLLAQAEAAAGTVVLAPVAVISVIAGLAIYMKKVAVGSALLGAIWMAFAQGAGWDTAALVTSLGNALVNLIRSITGLSL